MRDWLEKGVGERERDTAEYVPSWLLVVEELLSSVKVLSVALLFCSPE